MLNWRLVIFPCDCHFCSYIGFSPNSGSRWFQALCRKLEMGAHGRRVFVLDAFFAVFRQAIRRPKKIILYGAAPILFMFSTSFVVPDLIRKHKAPGELLLHYSHSIRPDTILVSDKDLVDTVCWFYKQSDVYLLGGGEELSYGLYYDDSKHRPLSPDQFRTLVLKNRGTGRVILVARARKYKDWMQSLPKRLFEDSNGNDGFVFAQF